MDKVLQWYYTLLVERLHEWMQKQQTSPHLGCTSAASLCCAFVKFLPGRECAPPRWSDQARQQPPVAISLPACLAQKLGMLRQAGLPRLVTGQRQPSQAREQPALQGYVRE